MACSLQRTPLPICGLHLCRACLFPLPEARCSACFEAFHLACANRCSKHPQSHVYQIDPKTGRVVGQTELVVPGGAGAIGVEKVLLDIGDF